MAPRFSPNPFTNPRPMPSPVHGRSLRQLARDWVISGSVSRKKVETPDWLPAPDSVSRMDRYVLLLYKRQAGGGAP